MIWGHVQWGHARAEDGHWKYFDNCNRRKGVLASQTLLLFVDVLNACVPV
jgi:hypothetical protein